MRKSLNNIKGFTLIEILVSMVIVAIGLLGLGAIQIMSLKDNQDAYLYTQATSLTYEMTDRIRANSAAWQTSTVPSAASDCTDNCNSGAKSCDSATMASYDFCAWKSKAAAQIGNGVSATIVKSPVTDSNVCKGTAAKLCVRLSWTGNLQSVSKFDFEMQP